MTAARLHAVFVDLDDTFLAPDKSIPAANLQLMDELAERGIELIPCTGRHVGGVPEALRAHPCVRHVVASNGGIVADLRTGSELRLVALPADEVIGLYHELEDQPITFDVFADGKAYTEQARYPLMDRIAVAEGLRGYLKASRTQRSETVPEFVPLVGSITKLTLLFTSEDSARACRKAIAGHKDWYYVQTSPAAYEVMDRRATKGAALTWLSAHEGWPIEGVVAFGDNNNDVSMIEAAGDGVVMENGEPQVKALADHIAPPSWEGGVALYLRERLGL